MRQPASTCLEEQTLICFAAGDLTPRRIAMVEGHLVHCAWCREMLAELALASTGGASSESAPVVSRAQPSLEQAAASNSTDPSDALALPMHGAIIGGRYRVERWIRRGGMSHVVAAVDLELERRVALKLLTALGADAGPRFIREGRTLARLSSQHVVRIYDCGGSWGRTPYLVMEYLEGEDLATIVARGALPVADALSYVKQTCHAVQMAHAAGIIHRDLKPSNLFLIRHGSQPVIKVLDFGISKDLTWNTADPLAPLTVSGQVLGSPRYMSPEQVRDSRTIDQRSDIWSLGVILYELLTGRPPFEQRQLAALAIAIATKAPRPPSELNSQLPPALSAIVMRCLEKEPDHRFATVAALAVALESLSASG